MDGLLLASSSSSSRRSGWSKEDLVQMLSGSTLVFVCVSVRACVRVCACVRARVRTCVRASCVRAGTRACGVFCDAFSLSYFFAN